MKCRICGRRVVKSVNRRFHWVEEQLCGLCFWGKIFGYFNSWTVDGGHALRSKIKVESR